MRVARKFRKSKTPRCLVQFGLNANLIKMIGWVFWAEVFVRTVAAAQFFAFPCYK